MIQYALECIGFQLLFLIIYDFFLKRETFFQWNRVYLIGTYIISLVLPWIKIEALKTNVPKSVVVYPEYLWNTNTIDVVVTASPVEENFVMPWRSIVLFGGMLIALIIFFYKLYQIQQLKLNGEVRYLANFTRVIIKNSEVAFSFFRSIFLGDKVVSKEHESIIKHELVHIKQGHSYDLVFFELLRIVNWFNPLVYIYQRRISELHEFIADAQVAKTHKKEQYELLLSQVFQTQHISFINPFFKSSLIKKRIHMLQKSKSKKIFQLKYLVLVPLVFGMLLYTSAAPESSLDAISMEQNYEDEALIKKVQAEIEQEVFEFGSLKSAFIFFWKEREKIDPEIIMNKEYYFKSELYMTIARKGIREKGDNVETTNIDFSLPSTESYNEYKKYRQAFLILDEDLKISISAYSHDVILLESENEFPEIYTHVKVRDVKDLTGDEIRKFNSIINDISKNNKLESIVLTDGVYSFNIYQKEFVRVEEYEVKEVQDTITRNGNTITYRVVDVQHRTTEEKSKQQELLDEILNSDTYDTLVITDGKMKTIIGGKTVPNDEVVVSENEGMIDVPFSTVDEVPVFPGCENASDKRACFQEKMYEHISKNFRYPQEAQDKGIQGKVNLMFVIDESGSIKNLRMRGPSEILEQEAARIISLLPKMKPGKQRGKNVRVPFSIPIAFKLYTSDDKINFKKIPSNSDDDKNIISLLEKYNSLFEDREALLNQTARVDKSKIEEVEKELIRLELEIVEARVDIISYENANMIPFTKVDQVPIFPGCESSTDQRACFQEKMFAHISKNFNYPQLAQDLSIQGKVNTMFVIGKDGVIKDVRKRGPSKLLEEETMRIIALLPKMKPGKQGGKLVEVPFSIPVTYKLHEESIFNLIPESVILKYPMLNEKIMAYNVLINDRTLEFNATKIDKDKLNQLEVKIWDMKNEINTALEKELN